MWGMEEIKLEDLDIVSIHSFYFYMAIFRFDFSNIFIWNKQTQIYYSSYILKEDPFIALNEQKNTW